MPGPGIVVSIIVHGICGGGGGRALVVLGAKKRWGLVSVYSQLSWGSVLPRVIRSGPHWYSLDLIPSPN